MRETEFIASSEVGADLETRCSYGTLSLVAGPDTCNAHCPFCIARMVPSKHVDRKSTPINKPMLGKALEMATAGGSDTVLITGNGEPTIFPDQITTYLEEVSQFEAANGLVLRKELQTNGILLESQSHKYDSHLSRWASLGLQTIAVSVSHYDPKKNREIYTPQKEYINLESLIDRIKSHGIRVRLTVVLMRDFIDNKEEVQKMLEFAKLNEVDEVSLLPVNTPDISYDQEVSDWIATNHLSLEEQQSIQLFIEENSTLLRTFGFGAKVYDFAGQSVCITDCVAKMPEDQGQRRLIYYPKGAISHDWDDKETLFDPAANIIKLESSTRS
jgi:pyruvate-formate lyase-activating enzyme